MAMSENRLDIRFIVYDVADIYFGMNELVKSVRVADIEPGNSGVLSLRHDRGARWTIREEYDSNLPRNNPHVEPLMFSLFCIFYDREVMLESLKGVRKFVDTALVGRRLEPGLRGDVPDFASSSPCGFWEVTRVRPDSPTGFRFNDTPIWNY